MGATTTTTTIRGLAAATVLAFARLGAATAATNGEPGATHLEAPAIRSFFYAGGGYADDGAGGHVFRDQMYVEHLRPPGHPGKNVKDTPVVLIHGQAQTGTNFLNKPDGGRGWASHLVEDGYDVYIVDQTLRSRSAWQPGYGADSPSTYSAELIQQRFTAPRDYNLWPQASNHTQWPGTGVMGDAVFDTFYSSNVQFIGNDTLQQTTMQHAGAALLDRIGKPAIVLGHSQGGIMPLIIADARPELIKALVLLEPTGPPFRDAVFGSDPARKWGLTDIPLTYDPEVSNPEEELVQKVYPAEGENLVECVLQAEDPAPRRLANLAGLPILVVTAEASYHAPYDYCTARFLAQAGCSKTEHVRLGEAGIHGNGHLFFMEKNSDGIYRDVLHRWMSKLK